MAKNLVQKGVPVLIKGHRNRQPVDSLASLGAIEVESLRDLAERADVIFLCLPSSVEVEETMLGQGGLSEHMRKGQLVVDTSTSNPKSTQYLAKLLERRGIAFIDAPLTRSSKEAEAGTLNVILGGDEKSIARARPLVDRFAENVFLSGPVGSAHRLKLINNFLSIGCALVVSEAIAAARATGIDTELLHRLASQGGANSGALQQIMPWVNEGQMNFKFAIRNAQKDLDYFEDMTGAPRPIQGALKNTLASFVAQGHGELFMPQIVDLLGDPPSV
ncbi:NAD(P)-dependent oxidoreductase [Microvirga ossetica]|nr:NAD(P)-dependent oxidoreductase [Microvirga ossetica]